MKKLILTHAATLIPFTTQAIEPEMPSEHARKTYQIFRDLVEVDTSKTKGNTPKVAQNLADELIKSGYPEEDI